MKKKLFFLMIVSSSPAFLWAQPLLTEATSLPQAGDAFTLHVSNLKSPGPEGAAQVWDFSAATGTGTRSLHYYNCATAPGGCGGHPGTTLIAAYNNDSNLYYIHMDGSYANVTGAHYVPNPAASRNYYDPKFTDPENIMRFPFTYTFAYADSFKGSAYTMTTWNINGNLQVIGDAYGAIITPAGTYANVLRIHRIRTYRESGQFKGVHVINDVEEHIYSWYTPEVRTPVYVISTNKGTFTNADTTAYWADNPLAIPSVAGNMGLSVFPQPARGIVHIRYEAPQALTLFIQLTDMMGRVVQQLPAQLFTAGQNEQTMDVSHLSAGLYLLSIQKGAQRVAVQKVEVL